MRKASKKQNRRLKRTVRRTIGALCLISAITIAAIPVPENMAYDPETTTEKDYKYNVTDADKLVLTTGDSSGKTVSSDMDYSEATSGGKSLKAFYVLGEEGNLTLDWQYKYFKPDGYTSGFLTKCNSARLVDTLEVSDSMYFDYFNILDSDYTLWKESNTDEYEIDYYYGDTNKGKRKVKTLNHVYQLDEDYNNWDRNGIDYLSLLEIIGKDALDKYEKDYLNYKKWADWNAYVTTHGSDEGYTGQKFETGSFVEKPLVPSGKYSDIYEENEKKEFLSEQIFGETSDIKLCEAQKVKYNGDVPEATPIKILIARSNNIIEKTVDSFVTFQADNKGYLCSEKDMVGYIGANAFKGVQKTYNLIVSPRITMFGDSAFEGSNIASITMSAGTIIGNRAFAGCNCLNSITIPDGTQKIGAEAFYSCDHLGDVNISSSVSEIGPGAFAECGSLSSVTIQPSSTGSHTIDKFAFYNCKALENLNINDANITSIDDAAFALSVADKGKLINFEFPDSVCSLSSDCKENDGVISTATSHEQRHEGIGDYLFAGRNAMSGSVVLPLNLGSKELPNTMFYGCTNLGSVVFPDKADRASFDKTIFYGVSNDKFYVSGPKMTSDNINNSSPRISTWNAEFAFNKATGEGKHVPYKYIEDGQEIYEVSDGTYVLSVTKNGSDGILKSCLFAGTPQEIEELTIPASVGDIIISTISDGCFNDTTNPKCILHEIKKFTIEDGSNITHIGDNAFYDVNNGEGAKKLTDVNIGDSVNTIGDNAFRACYNLENVVMGQGINSIGKDVFRDDKKLVDITFEYPSSSIDPSKYNDFVSSAFPVGNIGEGAFSTNSGKLTIHGAIGSNYAPYAWAMNPQNYADDQNYIRTLYKTDEPLGLTVILDNQNNLPTLVDYCHNDDISPDIVQKAEDGDLLAQDTILYSKNIYVPDGIDSIDVKGYLSDKSKNVNSIDRPRSNSNSINAYGLTANSHHSDYLMNGLFINNDTIESVEMEDVVYLPDNCFMNCSNLETVIWGDNLSDVGDLPFKGCTSLESSAGNDTFFIENGIFYERLDSDTLRILECLESRGTKWGSGVINSQNDPLLSEVRIIAERAFEECKDITEVDFSTLSKLKAIPSYCFSKCEKLASVALPESVKSIGSKAFSGTQESINTILRSKIINIESDAYDGLNSFTIISYKDSSGELYVEQNPRGKFKEITEEPLVKLYAVYGERYINEIFIEQNYTINGIYPVDKDQIKMPEIEGYVFSGTWERSFYNITVATDGEKVKIRAYYDPVGSTTPGVTPGVTPGTTPGTTPGATPSVTPGSGTGTGGSSTMYTLTVVYGSGSGQYPEGTKVIIEAIDAPAGKVFDKWIVTGAPATIYSSTSKSTTITTTNGDTAVTATYKDASSGSSSGSGSSSSGGSTGTTNRNNIGTSGGTSGNGGTNGNSGTSVNITKPGISDIDKAYASVSGSTDNFVVKVTESQDAANAVATALANKYPDMTGIKYFAMDISLYDVTGSNQITDTSNLSVNITMPIPDALRQYAGNNRAASVINGNQLEDLPAKFVTVDGVPCISFTATHFSPYAIYVDTNNLTYGTADYSPKTGDPIHPKWFVVIALAATSLILFLKKDKVVVPRTV